MQFVIAFRCVVNREFWEKAPNVAEGMNLYRSERCNKSYNKSKFNFKGYKQLFCDLAKSNYATVS